MGLSGASEVGVTERDVIFPLTSCEPLRTVLLDGSRLPEAEEVADLLLAGLVGDVLHLDLY